MNLAVQLSGAVRWDGGLVGVEQRKGETAGVEWIFFVSFSVVK